MQVNPFDRAIISDASCLITLTNINRLIILSQLYKEIIITPEVASEYRHSLPEWVVVQNAKNKFLIEKIHEKNFGLGESSSIALAMETQNAVLILDDERARNYARKNGIAITGTLTVVGIACDYGYIESYEGVCEDLRKVGFRFSDKLQNEVRKNTISAKPSRDS